MSCKHNSNYKINAVFNCKGLVYYHFKLITLIVALLLFKKVPSQEAIIIDFKNPVKPIISISLSDKKNLIKKPISNNEAQKILSVYMVNEEIVSSIPLIGNYDLVKNRLLFTPLNDLGQGLVFETQLYLNNDTIKKRFKIKINNLSKKNKAEVKTIFPYSNKIPANTLLFYVEFDQFMEDEVLAWKHVKLIDAKGVEKKMPWRNKSYWVNYNTLVLMVHPAYVKRGIESFKDEGELFTIGDKYTLLITPGIKDEAGRPIKKEFQKTFTITEPDRKMPELNYNAFKFPKIKTKEPVELVFSEGMDYVSILTGVKVYASDSVLVPGRISATGNDSIWKFIPEITWQNQTYELRFYKVVADFANNHLHRLFEISDLNDVINDTIPKKITFKPKIN